MRYRFTVGSPACSSTRQRVQAACRAQRAFQPDVGGGRRAACCERQHQIAVVHHLDLRAEGLQRFQKQLFLDTYA